MSEKIFIMDNWAESAGKQSISLFANKKLENIAKYNNLLFIGGVHGDEPEGVRLANELLAYLGRISTEIDWVLIPCLNPDGIAKTQRTNANGVDLNRNYPASSWSPEYSKDRYYPGPQASSEPEIKALVDLVNQIQPKIITHFHSWEPCIVYAGEAAKSMATEFHLSSGYELKEDIGYPCPGSLSEWAWKDLKIPVICIEEQEHIPLDKVWPNFQTAFKKILEKR